MGTVLGAAAGLWLISTPGLRHNVAFHVLGPDPISRARDLPRRFSYHGHFTLSEDATFSRSSTTSMSFSKPIGPLRKPLLRASTATQFRDSRGISTVVGAVVAGAAAFRAFRGAWSRRTVNYAPVQPRARARLYSTAEGVAAEPRPQHRFDPPVDNSPAPFRVKIYTDGQLSYGEPRVHRYEEQIWTFVPTARQLEVPPDRPPPPLDATPVHWVDSAAALQEMQRKLSASNEVAVDLESHSLRSFQGFTCLLQFSTRDEDFLVDALELRDQLHCLNDFFTNPAITKVFHGAGNDVVGLQRDFGIYVVNLFDTSEAAQLLGRQNLGLDGLLHECGVPIRSKNNSQGADWRKRPLSFSMFQYARKDTHYLLHLHDRLKRDLQSKFGVGGLEAAYAEFKKMALRRYEKPQLITDFEFWTFCKDKAPDAPMHAVLALLCWRDHVARFEDESLVYVLPQETLIKIARAAPTTEEAILRCCEPTVPALLLRHMRIAVDLLRAANPDIPLEDCASDT